MARVQRLLTGALSFGELENKQHNLVEKPAGLIHNNTPGLFAWASRRTPGSGGSMARLMLTVGDMQAWVQPVFGSVNPQAAMVVDEGHPLAVGDHEVGFFEPAFRDGPDKHVSAIMGENDALQLIAAWLTADEGFASSLHAQKLFEKAFNPTRDPAKNIGWLLP